MSLSTWSIEAQLQDLAFIDSQEMQICHILSTFDQLFSSEKLSFYRFSPVGYLAEGVAQLEQGQINSISYIRDDIRSLPAIRKVVEQSRSIFYGGMDYVTHVSSRYLLQSPIQGALFVPIVANGLSVGYIVNEYYKRLPRITAEDLYFFDHFGTISGKHIVKKQRPTTSHLSPRETDIIEALANGLSTKEMSTLMFLSEATIKQYIKKLLVKLNAKNRAHAVSIYLQHSSTTRHEIAR